jgi:phosphoribosyl-ATP pyrophosphohydrolase/phosphoribosyl-AMP cyclohydrolase
MLDLSRLDFEKGGGLVTIVTQDARSGAVLMVAHADREALERSIATGEMHYRSRSRGLWRKGETSGATQRVVSLAADCDGDTILARVVPNGPACHSGQGSCFGDDALAADSLGLLDRRIGARAEGLLLEGESSSAGESTSYTRRLLSDRNLRLKKLGEEATELAVACADQDRARGLEEGVDVLYHAMVALRSLGVTLDDLRQVVWERAHSARWDGRIPLPPK